jgi:excisionase family DNA binding protein
MKPTRALTHFLPPSYPANFKKTSDLKLGGFFMRQEIRLGYSRKQAAFQLSVSPRTIDYWIAKGALRAIRLGRRIVIPGHELIRLLQNGLTRQSEQ